MQKKEKFEIHKLGQVLNEAGETEAEIIAAVQREDSLLRSS